MTTDNPIRAAVAPQKSDAMDRAEQFAQKFIDAMIAQMEAHGWDLTKAAPRPSSTGTGRAEYIRMMSLHNVYSSLTTDGPTPEGEKPWPYHGKPDMRQRCPFRQAKFIEDARRDAAAQYEAFVAKLVSKVGACTGASLKGSHVWGHSFLTVEFFDEAANTLKREVWKTQQIVNVSKLGKVFNQWPTRKVKS